MRTILLISLIGYWLGLSAQTYTPGESYFGANNYVEYIAGNIPIILSAPHGGLLSPAVIPNRSCSGCSTVNDFNTQELTRALANALHNRTGCWPHVVINRLHRRKLDANRDLPEAADGNPIAGEAWMDFHDFLGAAKNNVNLQFGKGLYVDLHGHGHAIQRLELGYLLYSSELQLPDATLDQASYINYSSVRNLALNNLQNLTHAAILRGSSSLGALLDVRGYPATPSFTDPYPDVSEDYFSGGFNTALYGSRSGGTIDGVQIECNRTGIRDSLSQVNRFADSLAFVLIDYLRLHYFGAATATLCANVGIPTNADSWQMEISPNPYCRSFYIKQNDSTAAWEATIFDFYGNLLSVKTIESGVPMQISLAKPENAFVVLRRNGAIVAAKTILSYCR